MYRYYFRAYFLTTTEGVGDSSGYPATREERGEGIHSNFRAKNCCYNAKVGNGVSLNRRNGYSATDKGMVKPTPLCAI